MMFGCLMESGDWLWPTQDSIVGSTLNASLHRCCHVCVANTSCPGFELNLRNQDCILSTTGNLDSMLRALVLKVEMIERGVSFGLKSIRDRYSGRRLSHQTQNRSNLRNVDMRSKEAANLELCTPWHAFSNESIALRCSLHLHPHRFVATECHQLGKQSSEAVALALANWLFPNDDCASLCLLDPADPASAGWVYREHDGCYQRVNSSHSCLAAIASDAEERVRWLYVAIRACPPQECLLLPPLSPVHTTTCAPHYPQRNTSLACSEEGAQQSLELARSQTSEMWISCSSYCVYSVHTPASAGWRYDPRARCFRAFQGTHPCLQERSPCQYRCS